MKSYDMWNIWIFTFKLKLTQIMTEALSQSIEWMKNITLKLQAVRWYLSTESLDKGTLSILGNSTSLESRLLIESLCRSVTKKPLYLNKNEFTKVFGALEEICNHSKRRRSGGKWRFPQVFIFDTFAFYNGDIDNFLAENPPEIMFHAWDNSKSTIFI